MECKGVFCVPDYYKSFACKGGSCRATCCHGWDITLTMEEYFRLLGLECSPALRRRIDGAFYPEDRPTPERYAVFAHAWDGGCPLHDEDGYCALQRECGEDVLPAPCRYYPRHPSGGKCSVSNGCEQLCETLFKHEGKLTFEERELKFNIPALPVPRQKSRETAQLRSSCIDVIQNEEKPLKERFSELDIMLSNPEHRSLSNTVDHVNASAAEITPAASGLEAMIRLSDDIARHSPCMSDYCDRADEFYFGEGGNNLYRLGIERFELKFPNHEHMFAMLLVNRMFYSDFPFSGSGENIYGMFLSLCAGYALMRFFAAALPTDAGKDALADVCAALYRHIDNTAFDLRAAALLRRLGCTTEMLYTM